MIESGKNNDNFIILFSSSFQIKRPWYVKMKRRNIKQINSILEHKNKNKLID